MANLATKAVVEGQNITIHTLLMNLGKGEIIRAGMALNVDYALTVSCYQVGWPAANATAAVCAARASLMLAWLTTLHVIASTPQERESTQKST